MNWRVALHAVLSQQRDQLQTSPRGERGASGSSRKQEAARDQARDASGVRNTWPCERASDLPHRPVLQRAPLPANGAHRQSLSDRTRRETPFGIPLRCRSSVPHRIEDAFGEAEDVFSRGRKRGAGAPALRSNWNPDANLFAALQVSSVY